MEAKKSSKDGVLSRHIGYIMLIQVFDRDSLIDILLELPLWVPKDEREELKRLEKLVNKYERGLILRVDCFEHRVVQQVTSGLQARRVKTVATAKYHMVAATDGAKFFTWVPSEYYDIRKQCEDCMCYDFSHMENLVSKKYVKDAPRVRDIDFVSCSHVVYQTMIMDWTRYLEAGIPHLLEDGINLVIRCSYKFMHYITHETTMAPPPSHLPRSSLTPGYRFHPTDEELVRYYLRRKVCRKPFRFQSVSETDFYKSETWELAGIR
ncbi:hypothetical protein L1987_70471 [Smallanthus sonchifolius]|uniref:Uncharacterized protein n=1 Tax=Smallanthus sonchifolius TaxID=185202 RepID=A0ACB9ANY9_9ASTR|nr:hypothetical protein L1987_70471 [Smallanthus sonchifolius]